MVGGWSEIGAAAQIGLSAEVFAGVRMFTPAQGIAALERIMTSKEVQVGVIEVFDWNVVKQMYKQGRYFEGMQSDMSEEDKFGKFDYLQ